MQRKQQQPLQNSNVLPIRRSIGDVRPVELASPLELWRARPIWAPYKFLGTKKPPVDPATGLALEGWKTRPQFWTHDEAFEAVQKWKLPGIGFFAGDDIGAFDLDSCLNHDRTLFGFSADLHGWVNTYSELSPRKQGLHLVFTHASAHKFTTEHEVDWDAQHKGKIGLYLDRHFVTYTGEVFNGSLAVRALADSELDALVAHASIRPQKKGVHSHRGDADGNASDPARPRPNGNPPVERTISDDERVQLALRADRDFKAAWYGEGDDKSALQQSLWNKLAFWCEGDHARMRAVFEQSPLYAAFDDRQLERFERRAEVEMADACEFNPERFTARSSAVRASHATARATSHKTSYVESSNDTRVPKPPSGEGEGPNLLDGFSDGDVGNAERVLKLYRDDLGWCEEENNWYVWDGRRFERNAISAARKRVHKTLKLMAHQAIECKGEKDAVASLRKIAREFHSTQKINNALTEARVYVHVATTDFDQQRHLLNCPDGTLDLRTKERRPHRRADKLTRMLPWKYDPTAKCPNFDNFLLHIMGGDPVRVQDLVYLLGYSLTGETREKAVMVCYGDTDTGKTTLLNFMRLLLGEYATTIQVESLMTKERNNAVQEDLWDLAGRRFAMTSETEKNQKLAVARLKQITQGQGVIKVIPKFKGSFEFAETHKLWMDCNYLPIVRGEDDIWGRLYPIDFQVVVPKEDQDPDLINKLLKEAPGVLAKLVGAAHDYYERGLPDLKAIHERRQAWRIESSTLALFMEARCTAMRGDHKLFCPISALWPAYRDWCIENEKTETMPERAFTAELKGGGFTTGQHDYPDKRGVRVWWGIAFK